MPNPTGTVVFDGDINPIQGKIKALRNSIRENLSKDLANFQVLGETKDPAGLLKDKPSEAERLEKWHQQHIEQYRTVADAKKADTAATISNAKAYKELVAERKKATEENQRYQESLATNTSGLRTVSMWKAEQFGDSERMASIRQRLGIAKHGKKAGQTWWEKFVEGMSGTGSGATSQLVSVASNTLSSLGSGISPARIIAQQGPNVLQAVLTLSENAVATLKKYLINPITGVIVGAVIGALAGWSAVKSTLKDFTAIGETKFSVDYIPKTLQRINLAVQGQLALARAVQDTARAYDSVTAATERSAKAADAYYAHARRINQLSNASDAAKTRRELEINQAERAEALERTRSEAAQLTAEARQREAESAKILSNLNSEPSDAQHLSLAKARLETARQAVEIINRGHDLVVTAAGPLKDTSWQDLKVAHNEFTKKFGGFSYEDFKKNEAFVRQYAFETEKAYKEAADRVEANKTARAKAAKLHEEATTSAQKATELNLDLPRRQREMELLNLREATEARARLLASPTPQGDFTANQRIGAFAPGSQATMVSLTKTIADNTRETVTKLDALMRTFDGADVNRSF